MVVSVKVSPQSRKLYGHSDSVGVDVGTNVGRFAEVIRLGKRVKKDKITNLNITAK